MAVPGFSSLSLGEDDSVHKSGYTRGEEHEQADEVEQYQLFETHPYR